MSSNELRLEKRYVFILAVVQFCHILDFVIMMPLGPIFMREFSITPTQFGLLVSAYNLSAAPFSLLMGIVSDRFDRKKFLLINFIGFIVSTVVCGLANNFSTLLVARVLAGAFGGILGATVLAILTDLIPDIRRGSATGTIMTSFSFASVLGVPIGLMIATTWAWKYSFWGIGLVSIVTWFLFLKMIPSMKPKEIASGTYAKIIANYAKVAVNPNYMMAFFLIVLVSFASFLIIPFISPYSVLNIGITEQDLKFIYLVGGFFTIFSAKAIGRLCDKWGVLKSFYFIGTLSMIPVLVYTNLGPSSVAVTVIVTTFFMMLVSGRFVPCVTMATKIPSPGERGAFMSFLNATRALSTAAAAYVGGLIVVENSSGQLEHYNYVGYLSVFMVLMAFIVAIKVYKNLPSSSS
ncbi:MAG: MFS transporter [Halobacteriovoraceae bacterium]|nr:MFS transporter [Halobacteriovoraceae bacterium]